MAKLCNFNEVSFIRELYIFIAIWNSFNLPSGMSDDDDYDGTNGMSNERGDKIAKENATQ